MLSLHNLKIQNGQLLLLCLVFVLIKETNTWIDKEANTGKPGFAVDHTQGVIVWQCDYKHCPEFKSSVTKSCWDIRLWTSLLLAVPTLSNTTARTVCGQGVLEKCFNCRWICLNFNRNLRNVTLTIDNLSNYCKIFKFQKWSVQIYSFNYTFYDLYRQSKRLW